MFFNIDGSISTKFPQEKKLDRYGYETTCFLVCIHAINVI